MSTFMCKPETIGAIADYIWENKDTVFKPVVDDPDTSSLFAPKLNGDPCDRDDVYKRLWNMNAHALTLRYTDHAVTEFTGEYELYPAMPVRKDAGLVAKMDCFLYQCTEGDIPKSWAFLEVQHAEVSVMVTIVRSTKEYQEEPWE